MPAVSRRKNLPVSRRREKEDEDEELGAEEDSYTDDSEISDDDAATEGSITDEEGDDVDEGEAVDTAVAGGETKANGNGKAPAGGKGKEGKVVRHVKGDTDVMLNGIRGADDAVEVDFADMGDDTEERPPPKEAKVEIAGAETEEVEEEPETEERQAEKPQDKRRGDHEDYKKRRDADPTFVPNRGGFYLHDHRHGDGGNGFRPFARGGARGGRGRFPGYVWGYFNLHIPLSADEHEHELTFPSGDFAPQSTPLEQQWQHDMHEEVHQEQRRPQPAYQNNNNNQQFVGGRQRGGGDAPRSFGRTVYKGTVQIQVNLPGMKAPITFSEVPSRVYTRLPYHRPPLRRDKPVRIAIPEAPVRYIYPSPARSFIFIPRAMRPGGSGYIRGGGRGRGNFYSQGRSVYGGSTGYSPSIGMSRRSSLHNEVRPSIPIPTQTAHQQAAPSNSGVDSSSSKPLEETPTRPIVKLPVAPAAPKQPLAQQHHQNHQSPQPQNVAQLVPQSLTPKVVPQHPPPSYTPSINPAPYREHRATPKIPMHQPRPQKAVNVAEIDSPAVMHYQGYNGAIYPENIPTPNLPHMYAHSRHPSYPSQTSGTPLSHIPEGAVHARSFHPSPYPPQGAYYQYPHQQPIQMHPMSHTQPMHHDPRAFVPPPPPYVPSGPSPMPNGAPSHYVIHPPQQHQPQPPVPTATPTGPTTIAQESNGMVFYSTVPTVPTWDPNQYYYPQAVTPAPDNSVNGVPANGAVYYYPTTHTPHQQGVYYTQ
ncbi:hypothetical protein Q9L58_001547 [Maublancomyces gigas]|uniref:Btz domain-containing protein n=1 Tax=Discina gigas TaxID=1032678 RepID=A0ABR3GTQ3_9PEZI